MYREFAVGLSRRRRDRDVSAYASTLLDDHKVVPVSHHYAKKQPSKAVFLNALCPLRVRIPVPL